MKISQAVGMGFLIMGAIGYFIKLSETGPSLSPSLDRFPTWIDRHGPTQLANTSVQYTYLSIMY